MSRLSAYTTPISPSIPFWSIGSAAPRNFLSLTSDSIYFPTPPNFIFLPKTPASYAAKSILRDRLGRNALVTAYRPTAGAFCRPRHYDSSRRFYIDLHPAQILPYSMRTPVIRLSRNPTWTSTHCLPAQSSFSLAPYPFLAVISVNRAIRPFVSLPMIPPVVGFSLHLKYITPQP